MYLDVCERDTSRYKQDTCKIHHDTTGYVSDRKSPPKTIGNPPAPLLGRVGGIVLGIKGGVLGVGGGGEVPFLPIIIRLLTLACRCLHCLCISGAALDDAEHSLTDLDFRNQISNAPTPDSRSFTHDAVGRAVGKTDGYSTSTYRRMTRGNFKVRTVK